MRTARFIPVFQQLCGRRHAQGQRSTAQLQDACAQNLDNRSPSQAGGSLVEVVIAVAIIAIMATGLIGSLGYGFMITQVARENQRATQILLEKVEVIRLYNWDQYNYSNNFVPKTFTAVYDPQATTNAQGLVYYGTLSLSDFSTGGTVPSYAANLREITVTLNWTTAGKIPHSRSLSTLIAKDGLQNYVY